MANIYLRSTDGNDADNGSTWALAKATLAGAFAVAAAGDTIYVSQNHAESQASAMTLTSPGTVTSPCKVLCVNDGVEPPTTLETTAVVENTGSNNMTFAGCAYVYGIIFKCATGATSSVSLLFFSDNKLYWQLEKCVLWYAGVSGSNPRIIFIYGSTTDSGLVHLKDTDIKMSVNTCAIVGAFPVIWQGGKLDGTVLAPTNLFIIGNSQVSPVLIDGVDLSAMGSDKNLILEDSIGSSAKYYLKNCKLASGITILNASQAIKGQGGSEIYLDNCDFGDTNYKIYHLKYQGSIVTETTIKRTGGANDGETGFCWKMISLATPQFYAPLSSPPIVIWNEMTGSVKTLTVEIIHDSVTALKDDEVWVEVEYLGTSGYPLSLFASDRKTDIMAEAANQETSLEIWVTTGLTNPNKQKLSVAFTPQGKGPVIAKIMFTKNNYTVYICPKVAIT